MKKLLALVLALVMVLSVSIFCASCEIKISGVTEVLVGVALMSTDQNTQVIKDYLDDEIGPALNMRFDYSEAIDSNEKLVTFIENESLRGAKGIINLYTSGAEVAINKCEELGMFIQNQKSALDKNVVSVAHNLGNCGASAKGMETAYKALLKNLLNDGKDHSILIYSCAAAGKMAESHYYSTLAALETMEELYGLTYSKSKEEIAQSNEVGELSTGKSNIKVYLVPGFPHLDSTKNAIQSAINTGNYDVFFACASFSNFSNYIDEVEKSKGMDIKVVGTASIEAQTATGFSTLDSRGSTVLNAAVINPLAVAYAINAVSIRNAVDGYADMFKVDGSAVQLNVEPWGCKGAADYAGLTKLDAKDANGNYVWVITGEEAQQLCVSYNSNATLQTIQEFLSNLGNLDALLSSKLK